MTSEKARRDFRGLIETHPFSSSRLLRKCADKFIRVETEISENDSARRVNDDKERRAACAVVIHEGWIVAPNFRVMTKGDFQIIFQLHFTNAVLAVSRVVIKGRMYDRKAKSFALQALRDFLHQWKSPRVATRTFRLKTKNDFIATAKIRQFERRHVFALPVNPKGDAEFGGFRILRVHIELSV